MSEGKLKKSVHISLFILLEFILFCGLVASSILFALFENNSIIVGIIIHALCVVGSILGTFIFVQKKTPSSKPEVQESLPEQNKYRKLIIWSSVLIGSFGGGALSVVGIVLVTNAFAFLFYLLAAVSTHFFFYSIFSVISNIKKLISKKEIKVKQ